MSSSNLIPCGVHYNDDNSVGRIYWDPMTCDIKLMLNDEPSVLHGLECKTSTQVKEEQLNGTLAALGGSSGGNVWGVFHGDGGLFVLTATSDDTGKGYFYKGDAARGPIETFDYEIFEAEGMSEVAGKSEDGDDADSI